MPEKFMEHPNSEVRQAIVRLCDVLCTWERNTGIQSVLIIREGGFVFRAMNGRPGIPDDVLDSDLVKIIEGS